MREIKFRAWNKHDKQLATVTSLGLNLNLGVIDIFVWTSSNGNDFYSSRWIVEETELMQFTGLKDKNGKEIFEGDIMRSADGQGISFVVWCLDGWRFNSWMPSSMDLYYHVDTTRGCEIAEIIGDIYQNPELLKGQQ